MRSPPAPVCFFLELQLILPFVHVEWWLAKWTSAETQSVVINLSPLGKFTMPPQDEDGSAWRWSQVYFVLGAMSILFCLSRTEWGLLGGVRAANRLYEEAAARLFGAPMSFFDSTPLGRY